MTLARWRRRRLAPILEPAVTVYPPPAPVPTPARCPDCTPTVPCVICRALGDRTRGDTT